MTDGASHNVMQRQNMPACKTASTNDHAKEAPRDFPLSDHKLRPRANVESKSNLIRRTYLF